MKQLSVGDKASVTKTFSAEEVAFYCARISGDSNRIHTDPAFAATMPFGRCIVPGIMATSLFGGLLGSTLPGEGTIHLGQDSKFAAPIFVDEPVTATIEITSIRDDKPIITFSTLITKENGQLATQGIAVVKYATSETAQ